MPSVTVVGSGIVGLTSAIILQEKGFEVTIVAKECFDKTLSSKVGAIWFPFEIEPKEKANIWASLAYERYQNDIEPKNGVTFIPFLTAYNNHSNNDWTQTLPKGTVRKAKPSELPKGIKMAFISIVPLAEPRLYLPYLFEKFLKNGGHFEEREIKDIKELAALNTLVINCTGLGAKNLCNDEDLQPMRGQILRCKKMNTPSFADSTKKGALSYIINRSNDCVIGGTDYDNDWNRNVEASDTTLILNRLKAIGYNEAPPEILEEIVGLRPKRSPVRFEFDDNFSNIFHNYGHGGAGFTVAWGCAIELAELLTEKK
ncbi:FAD-dependent oxidoreductase [Winogradskyella thalassocola]|uniref:D-amino-acid oxidase n=1 Tax=Winogradskyella thalassocola TaxID=262004 RepID=A0A1G8ES93_9FLAO|nr:FAD-dependent oxidoreductase [Winogradskyella thalassocola]SDH72720.1 D-amino-acid:oxygen oxidoreductase [Winogradskyella thalassocola]